MLDNHSSQWAQLCTAFKNQRVSQALFFVGPLHCGLNLFVIKFMQLLLCKKGKNDPCLSCIDCQMAANMEHPDVAWIRAEKSGGVIKIDQIRELQSSAYLTPQRSIYRIVAIDAADRMNNASANALLKILEEPAKHTLFILIAEQLNTVLPTVISRCQIYNFSSSDETVNYNLLGLGNKYPQESERYLVAQQAESIIDGLIGLLERKQHPCILAAQWVRFELPSMLWFLYLIYAQIQLMYVNKNSAVGPAHKQLLQLMSLLDQRIIFKQIDKINNFLRKLSHNININHLLALEDLLFSLVPEV